MDELRNFASLCRLFPLPGVVLFPHAVLPLHIFEPRYRQMTEDALATDGLVTIVQLRHEPGEPFDYEGSPPVEQVACIGKILSHERLDDGRFNFLLLGLRRVRLGDEVPSGKLYRLAQAELMEDMVPDDSENERRNELVRLFERISRQQGTLDPEVAQMLETALPLGALTDVVAHALSLPADLKQSFLNDCDPASRAEGLSEILREISEQLAETTAETAETPRPFLPPFSLN